MQGGEGDATCGNMSAGGGVGGAGAGWSPLGPLFLLPDSIAAGAAAREPITFSALSVAAAEKAVSMKAASKSHFPKRCSNELHLAGASEGFVATPKTTTRTLLYVVLFYKKKRYFAQRHLGIHNGSHAFYVHGGSSPGRQWVG